MKKNETENLIYDLLASQKPNKDVLSAARLVLEQNKVARTRVVKWVRALAGCSAVLLIMGIFLAIIGQIPNNAMQNSGFGQSVAEEVGSASVSDSLTVAAIILIIAGTIFAIAAIIVKVKDARRH